MEITNYFYKISEKIYPNRNKLPIGIVICFIVAIPIGLLNVILSTYEEGYWFFNLLHTLLSLLSALILYAVMTLFFLYPLVLKFKKLAAEKNLYKNHRLQELIFTWLFILVFIYITFGFLFSVYGIISSTFS